MQICIDCNIYIFEGRVLYVPNIFNLRRCDVQEILEKKIESSDDLVSYFLPPASFDLDDLIKF